jgi:hypothetical protein
MTVNFWDNWEPGNKSARGISAKINNQELANLLVSFGMHPEDVKAKWDSLLKIAEEVLVSGKPPRAAAKSLDMTEFWKEHLNQVQTTVSYLLITSNVANYIESGIKKVEWLAANPDCEICSMNADVQVKIGKKFPSGHYFPPAHEECACDLAPVSEFDF